MLRFLSIDRFVDSDREGFLTSISIKPALPKILSLYAKGMSTGEIVSILKARYDADVFASLI